jgi:curved DNA-binding protein CbpA
MDRPEALKILNLTENATIDDIKSAYRELSKKYHPDKNHDGVSQHIFIIINDAYTYLTDNDKYVKQKGNNNTNNDKFGGCQFNEPKQSVFDNITTKYNLKNVALEKIQNICTKNNIKLIRISINSHKPIKKTKEELIVSIIKLRTFRNLFDCGYEKLVEQCNQHNISINNQQNKPRNMEELIIDIMLLTLVQQN